jgi:glycosyltransferase A (GT-A) superfamily protein (DUF2064 family)
MTVTALVVARAPVPGRAKTRLAAIVGDRAAAEIAAAALLDTLDAVAAAPVQARIVALTGDLDGATCGPEIRSRLTDFTVIDQRGAHFAERLVNAHADAAAATDALPILQIGMDTPQVTVDLIMRCADELLRTQAVLGMARDGGWWVLGVQAGTMADCLRDVPMSRPNTGELTLKALRDRGFKVRLVDELADVDTVADVRSVRRCCRPGSRFAIAAAAAGL